MKHLQFKLDGGYQTMALAKLTIAHGMVTKSACHLPFTQRIISRFAAHLNPASTLLAQ
jgi:hypothetical protein